MPKVSVIVPVYNVEKYISKCLNSLVNQTLDDIEIIVVNDGSTDNSDKIIREYKKKYKNIIYAVKENGGLSDARNFGMVYATGEYIAFLDSDDFVDKTIYQKMYEKAKQTNSDYVECDFYWSYPIKNVNEKYKKINIKSICNKNSNSNQIKNSLTEKLKFKNRIDIGIRYLNKSEMMTYGRVVAWNKLIKREIIKDKFPKGLHYEDVEFFYKLLPNIKKFAFIEEPLIYYVQRENSLVNKQDYNTRQIFNVLDNVIDFYKNNGLYNDYKVELEYTYTRILLCSSLKRMAKIEDKVAKELVLRETWQNLNSKFPNWRKNKILNNTKDKRFLYKNLYMKTMNKTTFRIYSELFK